MNVAVFIVIISLILSLIIMLDYKRDVIKSRKILNEILRANEDWQALAQVTIFLAIKIRDPAITNEEKEILIEQVNQQLDRMKEKEESKSLLDK